MRPRYQPPPEFIVKIDHGDDSEATTSAAPNDNNKLTRDSTLQFWRDNAANKETSEFNDPPSKLIGQFLNKQKAAGGERSLDVDLDMDEFRDDGRVSNSSYRSFHNASPMSKGLNASEEVPDLSRQSLDRHESSSSEDENQTLNRRQSPNIVNKVDPNSNNGGGGGGGGGGGNEGTTVLRCTSIPRRFSGFGRIKTRSRLMDPPEIPERRSETVRSGQVRSGMIGKSGQVRSGIIARVSGMLGKPQVEEEEEDPLFLEDLPDEYKKPKIDAWTIIEWTSLVLLVTALACTLTIFKLKRIKFRGLSLWKWEVLVLVVICGRLVSGWLIRIIVFLFEKNFFMRKRILYFVYGVRNAVQNCIWLGLLLIAWHSVFDKELQVNNDFLWYVNRVMVCLVVGTALWLVKTLMVKVLASSFHVSTFFDRIQESLFNQYVIDTLRGPPLIEIKKQQEDEDRTMAELWRLQNGGATLPPELRAVETKTTRRGKAVGGAPGAGAGAGAGTGPGGGIPPIPKSTRMSFRSEQVCKNEEKEEGICIEKLHKMNHRNISAWNMKRLIKAVKKGLLTTLDEKALDTTQKDESSTQIRSEIEAISAARKIFKNVAKPKAKFIYLDDLMRFLKEEEAFKVLNLVEGSTESNKISKVSLKNWVVNSFVERRALAWTLNDTKTAVNRLHQMVTVIIAIIIVLTCLIILRIASGKFLLYITSQVVVVAFVFGNTCKTIFEGVIFVFVIHPFDVGDRCEVDNVQMIVEEMNILTTVFLRYDNQKIVYPNVTLATRPISNYYRSPDMGDSVEFAIHITTPPDKLAVIKQRITSYIESRSDHWYPEPSVVVMDFIGLNAIKLSVWLRHRMNHQNMGERWKRRALVVEEMIRIFKEMDIEYRLYPIDINVRAMPGNPTTPATGNPTMPATGNPVVGRTGFWNLPPPHPNTGN